MEADKGEVDDWTAGVIWEELDVFRVLGAVEDEVDVFGAVKLVEAEMTGTSVERAHHPQSS